VYAVHPQQVPFLYDPQIRAKELLTQLTDDASFLEALNNLAQVLSGHHFHMLTIPLAFIYTLQNVMDVSEFKTDRSKQLADFQKQYSGLKTEYSSSVVNALKEQDRSKQCLLIKQVLDTNKKITALLKSFSANIDPGTCKSNPQIQTKLRSDLDQYSKEYEEIQQGQDQLSGLKNAIERTKEKTKDITENFSWYAVLIFLSVVILIFIILFRTSSNMFNTQPSTSVFSGSQG
jgi:Fe2+ transport system protein B